MTLTTVAPTTAAPFYLWQFGSTVIPAAQGAFGWPAEAQDRGVRTLGGVFDAAGAGSGGKVLPYRLTYTGLALDNADTTSIRIQLDALRARCDSYDQLWLKTADGAERWAWARLLIVTPQATAADRGSVAFALSFRVDSGWYGAAHGVDVEGATLLTVSPSTISVYNIGNAPVDNAVITIMAAAVPITCLRIGITGICEFEFSGTIAANTALIIDCGACTVLNNGVDAYQYFQRTANMRVEPWLRLAPGTNSVIVARTGGTNGQDEITFGYADGWA
jgi:hypothetical protein